MEVRGPAVPPAALLVLVTILGRRMPRVGRTGDTFRGAKAARGPVCVCACVCVSVSVCVCVCVFVCACVCVCVSVCVCVCVCV